MSEKTAEIELTHPLDLNFCPAGQGAFYCRTILPSGLVTPDHGMTMVGTKLVPITLEEWNNKLEKRNG